MSDVRYYFDEHIARAVARGLLQRGVDAILARDVGMMDAADEDHLAYATRENRVVYTNDQDFLRLHAKGIPHAGIAFSAQGLPIGEVIERLYEIHVVLTAEEMHDKLRYL
jgi:predicted nuclease of predicted toxin-antitoxin system